ncbi:universal stress protein [Streptomyces sp. RB6PN25]|uniref:Universal stress protein n=1 Tax=Streptomyces humicola TaxID=2953240 RepID=A0ABT1PY64_9ACTN|nr:universal stress protein [Streptomyces humicola]MCQ4082058.1 universal stress protein [Streptomyces humicola]
MDRPVTAGLNGSPESVAAAHWAAREAELRGLPLRLVYAWEWLPKRLPPTPSEPVFERPWPDRMMGEVVKDIGSHHPQLKVMVEQIENLPAPALLDAAQESELLALGSRGLGTIAGFLAGSVSLAVVARAERPVVLVRADGDREASQAVREIVVGVDLGHPCEPVLEFAFDIATVHKATVRAVHAWHSPPSYGYVAGGVDVDAYTLIENDERNSLAAALKPWREKHPSLAVHEQLVADRPAQHLVEAASGAVLLVVGRRAARPPMGTRLGAAAHSVLHHAPCPVVIVPHD